MSVKAAYSSILTVNETISDIAVDAATISATVVHNTFNKVTAFDGTNPVTISEVAAQNYTAGGTIDLTALVGTNDLLIDGTSQRPVLLKLQAPATNADPIVLDDDTEGGYPLFGAGFVLSLKPGQEILANLSDQAIGIDGTHKIIDVGGTGGDTLNAILVIGSIPD